MKVHKITRLQEFSLDQWPEDMREQFSSILEDCRLESRSLSETTYGSLSNVQPLRPILEKAFMEHENINGENVNFDDVTLSQS